MPVQPHCLAFLLSFACALQADAAGLRCPRVDAWELAAGAEGAQRAELAVRIRVIAGKLPGGRPITGTVSRRLATRKPAHSGPISFSSNVLYGRSAY